MSRVRILGIGSPSGDDQAGWLVIDALRASGVATAEDIAIEKLDRPGVNLIALLEHAPWAILVDAMQCDGPIGEVRHFGAEDWPAYSQGLSSHGLGVLEALLLARELGSLPPRLDVYGIAIGSANPGEPAQSAVIAAAAQLAQRIAGDLTSPPRQA
ncbi:MAG: hydrogenase maturation protease [Thiobacillus sp.]|nr:hydrogenase maturation protease [Thiobacillus sp.]